MTDDAEMVDVIRRAQAGDAGAMDAAINRYLPWAKSKARDSAWPWYDRDEAFSAAMGALWDAVKDTHADEPRVLGLAASNFRCFRVNESKRLTALKRTAPGITVSVTDDIPCPGPDPAEAAEAKDTLDKASRLDRGFRRDNRFRAYRETIIARHAAGPPRKPANSFRDELNRLKESA